MALIGATLAAACTPVATFDMLATSDRDLFSVCKPALLDLVCKDGDLFARADCLESRGAAYGQLHSPKMRRSWLIANGCPASTVDAPPPKETAVAVATPPSLPPANAEPPPVAKADPPPANADPPSPANAEPPPPATGEPLPPAKADAPPLDAPPLAKIDPPPPTAKAEPALSAKAEPALPAKAEPPAAAAAIAVAPFAPLPEAAPPLLRRAPPVAAPVAAFSDRDRAETRERRLRDIIIAHGKEMKGCVDRQLKLMPDLRADGTLIIDVDANGTVPHAELLGADLAGTPLESCLRTVASRWRFPSSGRGYRIDAPVRVSGSGR